MAAALREPGPAYVVAYVDDVDATGHMHGPASDAHVAAATGVLDTLETLAQAVPADGETLLLVTADHGQMQVDPETTVFVNEAWPEIVDHLRRGADGRPLAPAGSARDLFLHVLPGRVDEVVSHLQGLLGDLASVRPTAELLASGHLRARRARASASGSATSSSSPARARRSGGGSRAASTCSSAATTAASHPPRC